MKKNKSHKISIIVPVYKSGTILPKLNLRIHDAMKREKVKYEIIYVSDSSPDNSWSLIKNFSSSNKIVKGILLAKNAGQHNALMAGLKRATGDYIVTIDDDLQHSPDDILRLINPNYDVVYANFYAKKHAFWKIAGSKLNFFITNLLLNKPRSICISSFRSIKWETAQEIIKYTGPFVYLDSVIFKITSNVSSINLLHNSRYIGSSTYGLRKSISLFLKMITTSSITPLRLSSLVGFLISTVGFILAVYLLFLKFNNNIEVSGWSSIMVCILTIGGIQLIALGIIGEYVGRSFLLANNSLKQYTEKECIGFD
jgi:glycosyltransferase involved in cell wall biosynthesis